MNHEEIVITGNWNGEPIWRHRTAEERYLMAIEENAKIRLKNTITTGKNEEEDDTETSNSHPTEGIDSNSRPGNEEQEL